MSTFPAFYERYWDRPSNNAKSGMVEDRVIVFSYKNITNTRAAVVVLGVHICKSFELFHNTYFNQVNLSQRKCQSGLKLQRKCHSGCQATAASYFPALVLRYVFPPLPPVYSRAGRFVM